MSLGPFLKNPFTDITGTLINNQLSGRCGDMEMRALECLEAYGVERGMKHPRCLPLLDDFKECERNMKQSLRVEAMRLERHRQYLMGERKEHYAPGPRADAL